MTGALDGITEQPIEVSYSYWPVSYLHGDPTVISNAPFPLSGVQFSEQMRGVGEMKASLQLYDSSVREMNPWDKFVPRKTGIVVVRGVKNQLTDKFDYTPVWHGVLWSAPTVPSTGRMELSFQTVESTWARRKITGPPPIGQRDIFGDLLPGLTWVGADQAQIVRDLLDPTKFSQLGINPGNWPGWITVDAPVANMGQPRDMTYRRGQETSLLDAHIDRSKIINGYEWKTAVSVLSGIDAYSAATFRMSFVWGYPRLGRQYGVDDIPRFSFHVDGRGNVVDLQPVYNGSSVSNAVWGTGSGYDDDALRAVATNSGDWNYGFLTTEESFSNPDVSVPETLQQQTNARLIQTYTNEKFVQSIKVRGDYLPYFGTYVLGDDCLVTTDDFTLPDNPDGSRGIAYISRIVGWTVTPPEGANGEIVQLMVGGSETVG
jgi:hypothetical protein